MTVIMINIPMHINNFLTTLNQTENITPTPRCLIVGGFVRDSLLGIEPNDVDLEIFGVDQERLDKIIKKTFGASHITQSKKFGTWKALIPNNTINISLPRTEVKTGKGYFGFQIKIDPTLTIKQAVDRRDFTVNALYFDTLTNKIIDPCGRLKDIKTRTLRAVNYKTFTEDPLRLYRAIQLVARFRLKVEPKTLQLLKNMAKSPEIKTLSARRIESILNKMYTKDSKPELAIQLAKRLGLDLPSIKTTRD